MITGLFALAQTGSAWPEADRLFHSDRQWLGADAAFSIDLGRGRVLWTFGDTFVARGQGDSRKNAAFVRNTVAIQTGYDPSHAYMKFYWRTDKRGPFEMFQSEPPDWMWPSSGIRVGQNLILFCSRVRPTHAKNSLGFRVVGWTAYRVTNPDEEPSQWIIKKAAEKQSAKVIMASAALCAGRFVYFLANSEPEHDLYLARLDVESVGSGKLDGLEWWSGSDWQRLAAKRRPIIRDAGTESSLQRDPRGNGFVEVNTRGFGATDIVIRQAQQLEGPWSEPKRIYRPPESNVPDAFVYASKSHPELTGADIIITYVANAGEDRLAADMSLYFPQFVRLNLPPR